MPHRLEQLNFWNVKIRVEFRVIIWFKIHDKVNNCTNCCKKSTFVMSGRHNCVQTQASAPCWLCDLPSRQDSYSTELAWGAGNSLAGAIRGGRQTANGARRAESESWRSDGRRIQTVSIHTIAEMGVGLMGLPTDSVRHMSSRSGFAGRQVGTTRHSRRRVQDAPDGIDVRRSGGKGRERNSRGIQIR